MRNIILLTLVVLTKGLPQNALLQSNVTLPQGPEAEVKLQAKEKGPQARLKIGMQQEPQLLPQGITLPLVAQLLKGVDKEVGSQKIPFEDGAVYEITNKLDGSALTIDSTHYVGIFPIFSRSYNGTAGQKWRLRKSYYGNPYKLIPTSKEESVLDLGTDVIGFWGRFFAFGNQKYWNLINVGDGAVKIQNWQKPELCLISQGVDKRVQTSNCENNIAQQWTFLLL